MCGLGIQSRVERGFLLFKIIMSFVTVTVTVTVPSAVDRYQAYRPLYMLLHVSYLYSISTVRRVAHVYGWAEASSHAVLFGCGDFNLKPHAPMDGWMGGRIVAFYQILTDSASQFDPPL